MDADVLIIGAGVAGLSLGAALAPYRSVLVLEAEDASGYHSSGRSAAFSHFGIGNQRVRALTAASRAFFEQLPLPGETPLAKRASALFIATEVMLPELEQLADIVSPFAPNLTRCDEAQMQRLFPPLRTGPEAAVAGLLDPKGFRIGSAALLQAYARRIKSNGGTILTGRRVDAISFGADGWRVACGDASHAAPILINAAGAWADQIASLAGVAPLGLSPLRRTIIVVDPPTGADVFAWPFVKTVVDDFYMLPEGGRLMASPVDEVPAEPGDAQPDDYDIALAAAKVEQYTTLPVGRIAHRRAGLRTFAADRTPVIGFDPRAPSFFWCAGQGGFGLQTAPALADAAAALLLGRPWPQPLAAQGVHAHGLSPERLIHG